MGESGPRPGVKELVRAKRALRAAEAEHDRAVEDARAEVEEAKRDYAARLESAREAYEDARAVYNGFVDTLGPVCLYGDRLEGEGKVLYLADHVKAELSASGNVFSETRVSGGGTSISGAIMGDLVAGPVGAIIGGQDGIRSQSVIHDARRLFLTAVSDRGSIVVELDPDQEADARGFVAEVEVQRRTLKERLREADGKSAGEKEELARAESDTAGLDTALTRFDSVSGDTASVDSARVAYRELRCDASPWAIFFSEGEYALRLVWRIASVLYAIAAAAVALFFAVVGVYGLATLQNGIALPFLCLDMAGFAVATAVAFCTEGKCRRAGLIVSGACVVVFFLLIAVMVVAPSA